jgi:ABC-2 type transport system permease protein
MSSASNTMSEQPTAQEAAPAVLPWRRLFYWSVRRELWENRSIYLAPLVMGGVALIGVMLSTIALPRVLRAVARGDAKHTEALMGTYSFAAVAIMITGLFVALFYCLSALHSERRDRSILFWKSLPVSDLMTVLSKAAIPIAVTPAVTYALIVAVQAVIYLWSTIVTLLSGHSLTLYWSHVHLALMWTVLPYGLVVNALWQAPIYAWFLLVSGWARRVPILWALGVAVVPAIVERGAFGTAHIAQFLSERFFGGFGEAFSIGGKGKAPIHELSQLDPLRTFSSLELWGGLIVAAAFLAAAVWLRRRREPI